MIAVSSANCSYEMLWLDFKTLDSFGKFIDFIKSAKLDNDSEMETSIVKV